MIVTLNFTLMTIIIDMAKLWVSIDTSFVFDNDEVMHVTIEEHQLSIVSQMLNSDMTIMKYLLSGDISTHYNFEEYI